MFKLKKFVSCILIVVMVFTMGTTAFAGESSNNESAELPVPISFKCDTRLIENAVLVDTINFELSESNAAITYPISDTNSDLIFIFQDVSTAINMSLIIEKDNKYCVGFCGKSATIYTQINPNLEHEFELSLGFVVSDNMKQTKKVDCCSGSLEIYQVTR